MKSKKLTELHAKVKFKDGETDRDLYHIFDAKIREAPQGEMENEIREHLKMVSPTPVSGIYRSFLHFAYEKPEDLVHLDYANVVVEAHLPYCLHLPNGTEMEIDLPDKEMKGLVEFMKTWTKRAQEDGVLSSNVDFYMADAPTYFNKSTILTPKIPARPDEGWDQYFTGRNIERMRDQSGTFRYTRLLIEFNPDIPKEKISKLSQLSKGEGEAVLNEIAKSALAIVNRVIDCYRYITKEEYVERLSDLSINMIYFKEQNQGFYIIGLMPGIETAMMNRSKKEITEVENILEKGTPLPLHELLILDSHSAFQKKAFTLAVVESFQALEIMIENYLVGAFKEKGVSQSEYEKKLDTNWKTKDRLNVLLKEVKGHSLNENATLWEPWHTKYDKVRNEIIHQGKQVSEKDTEETIQVNGSVIAWIESL